MEGAEVVKMESIGPTLNPLIPATVINHGPGPLVGIDIDVEVRRAFGGSDKLDKVHWLGTTKLDFIWP